MSRKVAVCWHATSFILAGCLFFFFVLPRWPELSGAITPTWATVLRIVTGAVLALTAVPVLLIWLKTRLPEFGTPELANGLRAGSAVGHLLAAVMIIGTAVVEIWVSVDKAGTWLFGVYGAAAAIAVLSAIAFYLALLAELPPPAPKPLTAKKADPAPVETPEPAVQDVPDTEDTEDAQNTEEGATVESFEVLESTGVELDEKSGLRNRRPQKSDVTS